MNDALTGMLTAEGFTIPAYARDHLWLSGDHGAVRCTGDRGLFALETPEALLTLHWGAGDGTALARLRWSVDCLDWDGTVAVGGYIDALHTIDDPALPEALVILAVGSQPLLPDIRPYATARDRGRTPIAAPDFFGGIDDSIAETTTQWAAFGDSPVLTLAQDALVSRLPVWCFGKLAPPRSPATDRLALPLVLSAMSLFHP